MSEAALVQHHECMQRLAKTVFREEDDGCLICMKTQMFISNRSFKACVSLKDKNDDKCCTLCKARKLT